MTTNQPTGFLLSDDMIFTSRITGIAGYYELDLKVVPSAERLQAEAPDANPSCVIVDVHNPGLQIDDLVTFLRKHCEPSLFILGYGSHVAADVLKAARQAGCDLVLPRSKFVEDMPNEMPNWFAGKKEEA
ncbi:MAG: hypothetical protein ACFCD0_01730 [Gemmataceae bacterium]